MSATCNNKKKKSPIELADYLREIGLYQESENLFYLLLNHYPCLSALSYDGLGRIAQDKGLYETSLHFYMKSLQIQKRSFTLNNIGCAHYYLEQYEDALQFYSQSLTLMKNELNQSICINNIGITYAKNNQYKEALQCFQNCLQIRKKYLSETHPQIGICYTNIGVIQASVGQFDLALQSYNIALKTFSSNQFNIHRSIIYQNMAKIFQEKNQFDRSISFYQDALNILQQFHHPNINLIKQQIQHLKQINQFVF
jgi:tetratricopeptide (TPR) repeat protein